MKKTIFIVTVAIAALLSQPTFASAKGGVKVDNAVLQSFHKDFILTSEIIWHKIADVFVVEFKQAGVSYTAYYTEDGILNSISSNIEKEKLPEEVKHRINKKYGNAEIITALKLRSFTDGISYVVHLYTKGTEKIIKTDAAGSIETIKTIR